jgi:alkanesulfonate monooxygenase SsuD/methylene tetrahydromethanopterin reductase-like flavin-dependent oxidoreductase (luciferase family)
MEQEYRAYNFDFPPVGVRMDQLEEAIQLIKQLWTNEPASYSGTHYRITDAYCAPRPDPIPPLLIGGGGEKRTLRLVAQYADWWNIPGGTAANYGHKLNVLRRHCEAVGRDYDTILKTWSAESVALAPTEAEARRIAAASPYQTDPIIGTPEQVVEQLRAFLDLGVEYFIVRLVDFPQTAGIELFVREVMPQLRAIHGTTHQGSDSVT